MTDFWDDDVPLPTDVTEGGAERFRHQWRQLGMPPAYLAKRLDRLGYAGGAPAIESEIENAAAGRERPSSGPMRDRCGPLRVAASALPTRDVSCIGI